MSEARVSAGGVSQFRLACVQFCASDEVMANVATVSALVREAHAQGAAYVATPEMTNLMENRPDERLAKTRTEAEDEALPRFRALAADLGLWLHLGSLAIRVGDGLVNRAFVIAPDGSIAARYDKIHLFDVDLPTGERFRESSAYGAGGEAVLVRTGLAAVGVTICYDLRFPHLFRSLAKAGAQILTVPSAFTKVTGEAHWHVLMRARAIECGAFVVAPAQCGTHPRGRQSYGHSLVVSPWGEVLADGGIAPGVVMADIDLEAVADARRRIPSLEHDRAFAGPTIITPGAAS